MRLKKSTVYATLFGALALSGCSGTLTKSPLVLNTVLGTVDPYFRGPGIDGTKFEQLTERVYTFHWSWYRNLIIDTPKGLVIIDPMNAQMSTALKAELDSHFPGKPVHTLFYSHYHLDHASGGAVLAPRNIIAHKKSPQYWDVVDSKSVLRPTRYISGDKVFVIGGVEIRALYLGLSHTDTLYAFHIPSERLLFTADVGLVKTTAPDGVPDRYAPGYDAAMTRLAALDFDIFVPSHFGYGVKQDLIDWQQMMRDGQRLAREAIEIYGPPGVRKGQWNRYFKHIYPTLKEKYGDWHGFGDMYVLNFVRDIIGEAIGY